MKFLILVLMFLLNTVFAGECDHVEDYSDLKEICEEEAKKRAKMTEDEGPDCANCKEGWDFNEFVGIVAGPVASVVSTYLVTDAYRDTQTYWADQYQYGQDACSSRFDSYLDYNITRGANPIEADDATGFVSANCNGFPMGAYAGYNGMGSTGWGGGAGMNGYLGAGYTGGMMGGMMGPNYGGMYSMNPGMSLGLMAGLGLLGGGGGIQGGLYINGGGGMQGGGGMMYPGGGMQGGGGIYINGGGGMMYPGGGGGMMYPGGGGGMMYPGGGGGMMYPGGGGGMMYPGGGFNASFGLGINPWSSGSGSYYNMNSQYYAQQQQYYQQQQQQYYQQQQEYYQQMQSQYQLNMDMNARAQGNQVGNYYADQALYNQYQNSAYDYYSNQQGSYYNSNNPYMMGNMQAGFSIGGYFGY